MFKKPFPQVICYSLIVTAELFIFFRSNIHDTALEKMWRFYIMVTVLTVLTLVPANISKDLKKHNVMSSKCVKKQLDKTELELAFLIHRHGDRTPIESEIQFSPNETLARLLSAKYGFGQLTTLGEQRSYKLGSFIRERYNSLLSRQYNKSEIYIRSTDSTRTKKTVLVALAAVYPPTEDNWSKNINWTPVPYTTIPIRDDPLFAYLNCPVYKKYYKTTSISPSPEIASKHSVVLNKISELFGLNITNTPFVTYAIYDSLISQKHLGVPFDKNLEELLPEIEKVAADVVSIALGNSQYANLLSGVLLKEFFDVADKIVSNQDTPKVHIHSAHDVNVLGFAAVTRVITTPIGLPKYNSLYSLELRRDVATGQYIVVPVYLEEPGKDVIYLQVEGCEGFCDLNTFIKITSNFTLDFKEYRTQCKYTDDFEIDESSVN